MPFLDGFAQGLNSTFSTAGWQTRAERDRSAAEIGILQSAEEREQEKWSEEKKYLPGKADAVAAEAEERRANAALLKQQELDAAWKNSDGYRQVFTENLEAQTANHLAEAGLKGQQAAEIAHSLTEAQIAIANAKTEADTELALGQAEQAVANAGYLGAEAQKIMAELTPERIEQRSRQAEADIEKARGEGAQAAGAGAASLATAEQTRFETEQGRLGPGLRGLANAWGFMQELFPGATIEDAQRYGATGELPETQAIPEGENAPEPEGSLSTRAVERQPVASVTGTPAPTLPVTRRPDYTEEAPAPAPSSPVSSRPTAAIAGPTAGPSQRPGAIPYTAGTRAEAPYGATRGPLGTTYRAGAEPPPPRTPERRPPAPQQGLDNTYRAEQGEMPSTTPRPMYDPEATSDNKFPYGTRDFTPTPSSDQREPSEDKFPYGTRDFTRTSARPGEGRVIEAQAGTRKLPLSERTRGMLDQASAATGYTVRVTSGGQPSSGPNRTGSHRHDVDPDNPDADIGAGDIQLIDEATGKPVSMKTPEGQQKIIEFMRAARDAGATGFGAGVDYMGENTIHVGFGDPGVWGAGGKRANAPDWLVAGMEGGVGGRPSAIPQGTGSRPAGVARAYQGLQQRDMPQMQAAVLAGNIQQESSGNPNSVNEAEGAEGIIQWRQDRLDKLKAFASEQGTDYRDLDTQLDFLIEEGENRGSGQDKAAWQEFMSATTPEAANAALKKFIRYGDESAGTRLGYAENLLRGGGGEVTGERLISQSTGGRRMPTPRGEVASRVNRQFLVQSGISAAKEGAKAAVLQAGLGGPAPAITDTGREARTRGFVSGQGAAGSQEMANAQEAVQKALPRGVKLGKAELNLMTLASAYDWYLNVEGDPEKAKAVAAEIYQSYKRSADQYMAMAKSLADGGDLDKAALMAAKAYAFIPDGQEAKFTKDGDNYLVTITDLANPNAPPKVEQLLTPDEMYRQIMEWQSTNFDKEIRRAAGMSVPSEAFEAGQAQLTQPLEGEAISGQYERQAIPVATPIDMTNMTDQERGTYQTGLSARNTQIAAANTATAPAKPESRENIDTQLQRIQDAELAATGGVAGITGGDDPTGMGARLEPLREVYGNKLNSIFSNMLQANPNEVAETVVDDLANAIDLAKQDPNRLPLQAERGDIQGTWKVRLGDSPTVYNLPSETAMTIRNGIMAGQAKAGQEFTEELGKYAREKPTLDREAADAAAARRRFGPSAIAPMTVRPQQRGAPAPSTMRPTPPNPYAPQAPVPPGPYQSQRYPRTIRGPAIPLPR